MSNTLIGKLEMSNLKAKDVTVRSAVPEDYGEVFTLQRAAFVDESILYASPDVPALTETLAEFTARLGESESWVAVDRTRIVGAGSLRAYRGIPDVERLMVAPDRRGEGISSKLLTSIERAAIDAGHRSLQLIVGDLAVDNQRIYLHLGWRLGSTFLLPGYEQVLLHNMTKNLAVADGT